MEQAPPPFAVLFAAFLEHVRTTESITQSSSDLEDILQEQELQQQRNRNLSTAIPSRDECFKLYIQILAANEHLKYLFFHFTRFADICFLKHYLHSNEVKLQLLLLKFDPRGEDGYSHYDDLDDEAQDVEIEHTLAHFVGLRNLHIQAHHSGAPRWMQAMLRGISQNPSLRGLSMFNMDDFGLQEELDWTKSRLQKLHIEECDFSFSTWKKSLDDPIAGTSESCHAPGSRS